MKILVIVFAFLPILSFSQSIKGIDLPQKAKTVVIEIMREAQIDEVEVTSSNRTVVAQIDAMIEQITKNGVEEAKKLYGVEGDAVIDVYVQNKGNNKSIEEIKFQMTNELKRQLPSAIANNRLMHIGRESQFIVFDISIAKLKPFSESNAFQTVALKFVTQGKVFRFLGTNSGEKDAYHFEVKL